MDKIKRRKFLKYSAATITMLPLSACYTKSNGAQKTTKQVSSRVAKGAKVWPGLESAIILNNLGGLINMNQWPDPNSLKIDPRALKDARDSGVTALNMTIGYTAGPMEPYEHSISSVKHWDKIIQSNSDDLIKVLSTQDIIKAKQQDKIGVIFGFQNAAMMGDDAARVEEFAKLGVKIIQLTYNIRNQLGDGSMVPGNRGLTKFGREVLERLNDTNTIIDLSHSGEQTCLDAIAISSDPICISHTGCRALADTPRNKSDKELRLLANKGGVVGIYFMPFLKEDSFPTVTDVIRHIEHAINVCGEDHVGLGTDGSTTQIDDMVAMHKMIDKQVTQRIKMGIAAKGEKAGVTPFIPGLEGPDQFHIIADKLYSKGHSSARIEKILGGNFMRLNKTIWGA